MNTKKEDEAGLPVSQIKKKSRPKQNPAPKRQTVTFFSFLFQQRIVTKL